MSTKKSSVRMSINGHEFYAEGDEAEVSRKLNEFMAQGFAHRKGPDWRKVLGVTLKSPTLQHIEKRFRVLARKHHPDKGGDRKKFEEIVQAREAARLELAS